MSNPQKVLIDGSWQPLMTSDKQPAKECCCEPPADCCLYPFFEGGDIEPGYPFTDLIDQVVLTINGSSTTLDKYLADGGSTPSFSPTGSDPSWIFQNFPQSVWCVTSHATGSDNEYGSFCLISSDWEPIAGSGGDAVSTTDLFSDTYLLDFDDTDTGDHHSFTIMRNTDASLCCWFGTDGSTDATVCYGQLPSELTPIPFKWNLEVEFGGFITTIKATGEDQSSLVGTYEDSGRITNIVIS